MEEFKCGGWVLENYRICVNGKTGEHFREQRMIVCSQGKEESSVCRKGESRHLVRS